MTKKKKLRVRWDRVFIACVVVGALGFGIYKSCSWIISSVIGFFSEPEVIEVAQKPKPIQYDSIVVIDPGHGGMDAGAKKDTLYEKDIDLKVAEYMKAELENHGIKVFLTRDDDSTPYPSSKIKDLRYRAGMSAQHNAQYFVSIHVNDFEGSQDVCGFEVYEKDKNSHVLAQNVSQQIDQLQLTKNRGIVEGRHLQVLRDNTVPSILVELGYINSKDYFYLSNDQQLNKIAQAIVRGLIENIKNK